MRCTSDATCANLARMSKASAVRQADKHRLVVFIEPKTLSVLRVSAARRALSMTRLAERLIAEGLAPSRQKEA